MNTVKLSQVRQNELKENFSAKVYYLAIVGASILNHAFGLVPALELSILVAAITFIVQIYYANGSPSFKKMYLGLTGILSIAIFNYMSHPASAQFMNKAQAFFTSSFSNSATGGTTNIGALIGLTFNVLRAIYVIYLAVSLIGIFNSMRNDEDWMTAARTPMIVLMSITIGDLLAGLITGT